MTVYSYYFFSKLLTQNYHKRSISGGRWRWHSIYKRETEKYRWSRNWEIQFQCCFCYQQVVWSHLTLRSWKKMISQKRWSLSSLTIPRFHSFRCLCEWTCVFVFVIWIYTATQTYKKHTTKKIGYLPNLFPIFLPPGHMHNSIHQYQTLEKQINLCLKAKKLSMLLLKLNIQHEKTILILMVFSSILCNLVIESIYSESRLSGFKS